MRGFAPPHPPLPHVAFHSPSLVPWPVPAPSAHFHFAPRSPFRRTRLGWPRAADPLRYSLVRSETSPAQSSRQDLPVHNRRDDLTHVPAKPRNLPNQQP